MVKNMTRTSGKKHLNSVSDTHRGAPVQTHPSEQIDHHQAYTALSIMSESHSVNG